MTKGEILRNIRSMSSGTIANLIGNSKYVIIDRAATAAMERASALTDAECKAIETFEDICNLFKKGA